MKWCFSDIGQQVHMPEENSEDTVQEKGTQIKLSGLHVLRRKCWDSRKWRQLEYEGQSTGKGRATKRESFKDLLEVFLESAVEPK